MGNKKMNAFAKKLQYLRKNKKLTQYQISKILNIDRSTYSYYELGKSRPQYETLIKIAELFNVSTDYLLIDKNKT